MSALFDLAGKTRPGHRRQPRDRAGGRPRVRPGGRRRSRWLSRDTDALEQVAPRWRRSAAGRYVIADRRDRPRVDRDDGGRRRSITSAASTSSSTTPAAARTWGRSPPCASPAGRRRCASTWTRSSTRARRSARTCSSAVSGRSSTWPRVAALVGTPELAPYGASKAAVAVADPHPRHRVGRLRHPGQRAVPGLDADGPQRRSVGR